MSYRRNKSNKVPNVKLRPAVSASSASSSTSRNQSGIFRRKDSGFDSEEDVDTSTYDSGDVCPRPFKGVLLCATGINDKTTLFKQAIELGAQSLSDLTDRVTHVIAETPGSAKYQCALENGIPIMHPSWITESYKIWLRGDDVDLRESVANHILPIFNNVVISLTGIPSVERRMEINKLVTKNGGTYVKNLERPVKVTHLVCSREHSSGDEGDHAQDMREAWVSDKSEKMIYAQKFNDRGEAHIHIVWEEWLWDCLTYGGRFNEGEYLITKPRPKPKKGPQQSAVVATVELPIEPSSSNSEPEFKDTAGQKPSFHTTEEEDEPASVKRIPDVKLRIWETMLGSRGFEVSGGKLIRSPSKSQKVRQPVPPLPLEDDDNSSESLKAKLAREADGKRAVAGGSMLASFRRAKSFAPATKDTSTQKRARQPFQRVATAPLVSSEDAFWGIPSGDVGEILAQGGEDLPVASGSRTAASAMVRESSFMATGSKRSKLDPVPAQPSGIFAGMIFRALGEARGTSVKTAVENAGGALVDDMDAEVDIVVVRLVSGSKLFREESDDTLRGKYRTECWLERCMYEERICEPSEHIAFVPLGIENPIPGAEEVNLSFSGLDQSEGFWIRRLGRALGLTLVPNFSRRTTHLLCPSMNGAKFEKAREWNIPVVDMTWLEQMAREGVVPKLSESALPRAPHAAAVVEQSWSRAKSEGKEKEQKKGADNVMLDISNNDSPPVFDESPDKTSSHSRSAPRRPVEDGSKNPEDSFGHPGPLLANELPSSPSVVPEDPGTSPPRSRASTAEARSSSPPPHDFSNGAGVTRQPTLQELREDMQSTRIPSSESPSPVKPPSKGVPAGKTHPHGYPPFRISEEASKELHESIKSLLGKRQPSAEEPNGGPSGKRARPMRRTRSHQDQVQAPQPVPPPLLSNQFGVYGLGGEEDISMLAAEAPDLDDQSMRVTYEDPNQNNERERLLRLLDTQKKEIWEVADAPPPHPAAKIAGVSKKGRNAPTRTSSRVSGF